MNSKCCLGCLRCNQQEATIEKLTARLDDMEQRLIQFYKSFESRGQSVDCRCYKTWKEGLGNAFSVEEMHNSNPPSIFQSRKIIGIGCKKGKKSKLRTCSNARHSLVPTCSGLTAEHTRPESDMSSTGEEDVAQENEYHAKDQERGNSQYYSLPSRKAKFVNSSANQVRYAHLESKDGLAPVFHADTRIVYDRHAAAATSGYEDEDYRNHGKTRVILEGSNKPGISTRNASPLYVLPFEQLILEDDGP